MMFEEVEEVEEDAVEVTIISSRLIFGRLPDGVPTEVPPLYT